jgi:hypothetical protein
MIPQRFVVEYPERCLELLEMLEPMAGEKEMIGSFSLLVAASIFLIPYERMQARHPLYQGRDVRLDRALRQLDKKEKFQTAGFWGGEAPQGWRFSRIMRNQNDTECWVDEKGKHPVASDAENTFQGRVAGDVLRVVRNALAHGNIVYLNSDGKEKRNTKLQYLGFLSRYEETEEQKKLAETYRLVVTTEEEFLRFIKKWAAWVATFHDDTDLSQAA